MSIEAKETTVGSSLTECMQWSVEDNAAGVIALQLDNDSGGAALTQLVLDYRRKSTDTWETIEDSSSGGWTSSSDIIARVTSGIGTLAAGSVASVWLACWPGEYRLRAKCGSSTTLTVTR